ncbi:helix-turn-helix domain-containing protein, partial [bacterium]|nr:helix-turn-helix domain-containing protein [bacterium]
QIIFGDALGAAMNARMTGLTWRAVPSRSLLGMVFAPPAPAPAGEQAPPEAGFVVDRDRFEARWAGRACPLGGGLEFEFVERLHAAGGGYVPVETLADEVWHDPGTSKNAVQRVVSTVRRLFRDHGLDGVAVDGTHWGHYRLVVPGG